MLGKRLINSNSAASGATCTTDTLQILGDTSCIAYYKMSDATDESGNYDGTPTSVNFNVAGKFGNAGSFNGSSSYIDTNYTLPAISTYSLSLWFKTSITGTRQYLFADFNSFGNTSTPRLSLGIEANNNFGFYLGNGSSNWSDSSSASASSYLDGDWHNLVLAINGTSVKLYADGNTTPIADLTSTVSAGTAGTSPLSIGRIGDYSGLYFDGSIDNIRIFNKALTSSEVTTLYNEVYCVPTIVPTDYFEPVIYTGNGSAKSITSLNFKPDFVWIKSRSDAYGHILNDSVRGANKFLYSNTTEAEDVRTNSDFSSFDTNGFTLGTNYVALNGSSSQTYVAWNWKAGGADVLNQEGTIDSQVSANVDAGFSIVSYTGNGSTSQTYGHGLDSTPEMIITKNTSGSEYWTVWSKDLTSVNYFLYLNTTDAEADGIGTAFNSGISSTLIGIGNSGLVNTLSQNYISYAFHSVDGMSKFGSYTGTGATGNSIVTGFRPAYVMFKKTSAAGGSWWMLDNKRNTTNPRNTRLVADNSFSENTGTNGNVNFFSNGFELLGNYQGTNASSASYIFMAFAEEVFVPDNFFNDDSTLATYKLNGDAGDDSGNGYNGTASNVTYATGKFDEAAVFNGSSSYVENSNIPNEICKGYYTVNVWAYIPSSQSYASVVHFQDDNNGHLPMLNIAVNNSNWNLNIRSNSSGIVNSTNISVAFNSWNMITGVLHSGGAKFYINASEVASASFTPVFTTNTSCKFSLGRTNQAWIGSVSAYLNGSIDQVRVFDRVLSSAEITQLYNE